jgi:hypothetical protein
VLNGVHVQVCWHLQGVGKASTDQTSPERMQLKVTPLSDESPRSNAQSGSLLAAHHGVPDTESGSATAADAAAADLLHAVTAGEQSTVPIDVLAKSDAAAAVPASAAQSEPTQTSVRVLVCLPHVAQRL